MRTRTTVPSIVPSEEPKEPPGESKKAKRSIERQRSGNERLHKMGWASQSDFLQLEDPNILSRLVNLGRHEFVTSDLHAREILNDEISEPTPKAKFNYVKHGNELASIGIAAGTIFKEGFESGFLSIFATLGLLYYFGTFILTLTDKIKTWREIRNTGSRPKKEVIEVIILRLRGLTSKDCR